ncbi:hypothetical protein GCM10010193_49030 [Kitasatospora atroaurantiaca]|uniref:Uncharacterized protein n=1 Tax=Kitasatospora atroaurantiaca TaxID=285545 RepID=A0A561EYN1_9ACTN|nr:hypothetical protein [Kitasatospora atroaurantiaca]TWE20719.1 hypothetical protein FB465_5877 [Kitasatospora atroaurantiaca]
MTRSRNLFAALLLPLLLPVQLGVLALHHRMGRVRAARASGDRGAISIELALAIIVLVGIAGTILALLSTLASNVEQKIPDVPTAAQ